MRYLDNERSLELHLNSANYFRLFDEMYEILCAYLI